MPMLDSCFCPQKMECTVPASQMAAICTQAAMPGEEKQHLPHVAEFLDQTAPRANTLTKKKSSSSSFDVSFPHRKSHQLHVPGQSTIALLPISKERARKEREARRIQGKLLRKTKGTGKEQFSQTPSKDISLPIVVLCYALWPRGKKKKDSLRTHKRPFIIETNSGMTRASIFSNLVCIIFYA